MVPHLAAVVGPVKSVLALVDDDECMDGLTVLIEDIVNLTISTLISPARPPLFVRPTEHHVGERLDGLEFLKALA